MKSKLVLTMLALTVAVALVAGATMAWFTDTDNAGSATFTAGILSVDVNDGLNALNQTAVMPTITRMNPGEEYGEVIIDIVNNGNKKLAWFGDWTFTPGTPGSVKLMEGIVIKTMKMEMLTPDGSGGWKLWNNDPWYAGYNFIEKGRGAGPHASEKAEYDRFADMSTEFKMITLNNWEDNVGMAPQTPFEHMGALKPGNKYRLTVKFEFPASAGNAYQGNAVGVSPITIGFAVKATQVHVDAINTEIGYNLGTLQIGWMEDQIDAQPDALINPQ